MRRALPLLLLLSACDPNVLMRGYVDVPEPDGQVQKVHMVCRRIYDPAVVAQRPLRADVCEAVRKAA